MAQLMSGVSKILISAGVITEQQSKKAMEDVGSDHGSFVSKLISNKAADPRVVAKAISKALNLPFVDITAVNLDSIPKVIPLGSIETLRAIPLLERGNTVFVAMSDPTLLHSLDDLQFQSGSSFSPVVVQDDQLTMAIKQVIDAKSMSTMDFSEMDFGEFELEEEEEEEEQESTPEEDAPVVKFIQKMLMDAIKQGSSDIHFEPYEKFYRVRYRTDGVLRDVAKPPLALKEKIASRIKVISKMDISEKRIPQDGRMRLKVSAGKFIDFRVSSLPTLQGEKIVMRILDPSSATLGIDALGYEPDQKELLMKAIKRPDGMVLVTGPTGSGKTVSLYTCLNILNEPSINISTAEDPAEIGLPGINQVNVNDKVGLTFASALKSFLRQDPDIIMVGEIRDLETADIAMKAAQTGHMVMSTLHTNDAPTTLTRLMNMGVAPFNIASAVNMITAQRLGRRLCKECKVPITVPDEVLLDVGFTEEQIKKDWQLYGPKEGGCPTCNNTGYKGRVGIYQVMPISEDMAKIIMDHGNAIQIAEQAQKEGINDLRQSGILKIMQGLTSIEEVEAITNM